MVLALMVFTQMQSDSRNIRPLALSDSLSTLVQVGLVEEDTLASLPRVSAAIAEFMAAETSVLMLGLGSRSDMISIRLTHVM